MAFAVECMCWDCEHYELDRRDNAGNYRCDIFVQFMPPGFACAYSEKRKEKRKEAHNETR